MTSSPRRLTLGDFEALDYTTQATQAIPSPKRRASILKNSRPEYRQFDGDYADMDLNPNGSRADPIYNPTKFTNKRVRLVPPTPMSSSRKDLSIGLRNLSTSILIPIPTKRYNLRKKVCSQGFASGKATTIVESGIDIVSHD